MGERGKSVYFWHKTEENYNQGPPVPPTRSERFGHSTAVDFGRAVGRAVAAKRGAGDSGAAVLSRLCFGVEYGIIRV